MKKTIQQPNIIWQMLALITFVGLGLFGIQHHELWRDEFHSAMIAFESGSLPDLLARKAYEGHPLMWYLLLYMLKQFTTNWYAIAILHLCIASLVAALLLFKAPFRFRERILLVFGYFFLFEYGILARNYAIEMLFLFGICTLYPSRFTAKGQFAIAILLFLNMQTNFYGLLLSVFLSIFIALELLLPLIRQKNWKNATEIGLRAGLPILVGIGFSLWSIVPPADSGVNRDYTSLMNLFHAFSTIWKSYIPIPEWNIAFWNSNILSIEDFKYNAHLQLPFSIILLFIVSHLLSSHRAILRLFWVGTILMFLFTLTRYPGWLRHYGHHYIWLLVCLWLQRVTPADTPSVATTKLPIWVKQYFLSFILVVQVVASFMAIFLDAIYPFSNAETLSAFIKENQNRYPIVAAHDDFTSESYAALLNRKIYHPVIKDYTYYVIFNDKKNRKVTFELLINEMREDFGERADSILFVTHTSLQDSLKKFNIRPLQMLPKTIVKDEQYFLYQLIK